MDVLNDSAIWIILLFSIGYIFITIEHFTRVDKATVALMTAVFCWIVQFQHQSIPCQANMLCLSEHMGNISQIILFILGALVVVEIINAHKGFGFITERIHTTSRRKLLWMIGIIAFFLSSVLDNLTTTIVMISLLQKIISQPKDRLIIGAGVVIAANAGGAWTPIGDVTTTMLWIGGQLTAQGMIASLFLPSVVCMAVSFSCLHFMMKGNFSKTEFREADLNVEPFSRFIFILGIGLLIFVPVFKVLTGLPPFMGMLFALSLLWIITDIAHSKFEERIHLRVPHALTRVDLSGVLFFLGILLAVEALNAAGILNLLAIWLDQTIPNATLIAASIGLVSAVVDNVPLVAASMGMYSVAQFPVDSDFWNLVAYCAGTGGSILVIGSAAGVVFMGMEKVNFFWYLRTISVPALAGYFAGIATYLIM